MFTGSSGAKNVEITCITGHVVPASASRAEVCLNGIFDALGWLKH